MEEITDAQKAFLAPFLPSDEHNRSIASVQPAFPALNFKQDQSTPEEEEEPVAFIPTEAELEDWAELHGAKRPFVTLTYATSLDSKISLGPGLRTVLSGDESKAMTHYLRYKHDAILVGVGTAMADDPSLNCRYPGAGVWDQPVPFVVDPTLRWNPMLSKAMKIRNDIRGREPIVVTNAHPEPAVVPWTVLAVDNGGSASWSDEDEASHIPQTKMDWAAILAGLKKMGMKSVMIEGGATIINELLELPHLVDSVIITVAPTFLGKEGVSIAPGPKTGRRGEAVNAATLDENEWHQFGPDVVLAGRLRLDLGLPPPAYD